MSEQPRAPASQRPRIDPEREIVPAARRERPGEAPPLARAQTAAIPLARRSIAEAVGTFLVVFLGVGAVQSAVLAGAQSGVWQVAVVWAIAVALAIHATGSISGAHLNPAITAACAVFGGFPRREVLAYWLAQLAGAFLAAAALYLLFGGFLSAFETRAGIVRGAPGSEASGMCFGEYFPNPGLGTGPEVEERVTLLAAFGAEALGTLVLAFVVFALTDAQNRSAPGRRAAPLLIGLTVAALISVLAPLTQAGFNPARDFGPRLFAWLAGWGSVAIPGPRGGFFVVYVLAPLAGALAGAGLFRLLLRPAYRAEPARES